MTKIKRRHLGDGLQAAPEMAAVHAPAPCEHKRRYATWQHAQYDARMLKRRRGRPYRPWHCATHNCYHVGSVDRIGDGS